MFSIFLFPTQIKPVRHRDAGAYECQISTTPPTSHVVNLGCGHYSSIL